MKLDVNVIRLVQSMSFPLSDGMHDASHIGDAEPIQTHFFQTVLYMKNRLKSY